MQIVRFIGTLLHHLHKIGRKYMGAISKSEPIFTKLNTHHSKLNSVRYAKFRANRKIYRGFGTQFTLNRTNKYMEAISKSEPIFPNFNRARPWPK